MSHDADRYVKGSRQLFRQGTDKKPLDATVNLAGNDHPVHVAILYQQGNLIDRVPLENYRFTENAFPLERAGQLIQGSLSGAECWQDERLLRISAESKLGRPDHMDQQDLGVGDLRLLDRMEHNRRSIEQIRRHQNSLRVRPAVECAIDHGCPRSASAESLIDKAEQYHLLHFCGQSWNGFGGRMGL